MARITPACAGKTPCNVLPWSRCPDHPRVCGENSGQSRHADTMGGSPPRVRGKPRRPGFGALLRRITPACAGKTPRPLFAYQLCSDHPRVCGENNCVTSANLPYAGSPPRVRGKPRNIVPCRLQRRITPACAGKTLQAELSRIYKADHPRVCGENPMIKGTFFVSVGSPPRVRGKRKKERREAAFRRITPACAGKTAGAWLSADGRADHPRVCGENCGTPERQQADSGSPPRVRGKHFGNGVFPWLILVLSLDPL